MTNKTQNILSVSQNVSMASSLCWTLKPAESYQCDPEQRFIPKEQKGEGKREDTHCFFVNGDF